MTSDVDRLHEQRIKEISRGTALLLFFAGLVIGIGLGVSTCWIVEAHVGGVGYISTHLAPLAICAPPVGLILIGIAVWNFHRSADRLLK